jgi:hypothetical protein
MRNVKTELLSEQTNNFEGFRIGFSPMPSVQVFVASKEDPSSLKSVIDLIVPTKLAVVCNLVELATLEDIGSVVCLNFVTQVNERVLSIQLGAGHFEATVENICTESKSKSVK